MTYAGREVGARSSLQDLAEWEGFEPSIRRTRIHALQACPFNHSGTTPEQG